MRVEAPNDDIVRTAVVMAVMAITMALAALTTPLEAQCAMCRRVLESGDGQALAGVLRQAIVLLLVTPFILIGVIGTLAVRIQRRTRRRA